MRRLAVLIILPLSVLLAATQPRTYQTNFPATENPISENGNWINGETVGAGWGNIQTTGGHASGTNVSPATCSGSNPTGCNDSTAVLTGTWGSDQTACGTVYISPSLNRNNGFYEIELRLNTSISANNITGYEFTYSVRTSGVYAGIVRWNGPFDNFTVGVGPVNNPPTLANGDVLCAIRSGATLTFTRTPNGSTTPVPLVTTNNSLANTYTGGAPGIGMFNEGGVLSDDTLYGFSSFQATDNGNNNPPPPTNLRVTNVQ
jgi:hypothetical protein